LTPRREISRTSFAIVANGFADGPAQALRDYLTARRARVVTVFHPLTREQGATHVISEYETGETIRTRSISLPPPAAVVRRRPIRSLRLPGSHVDRLQPAAPAAGARKLGRASTSSSGRSTSC
jgi:hypothetical protein